MIVALPPYVKTATNAAQSLEDVKNLSAVERLRVLRVLR